MLSKAIVAARDFLFSRQQAYRQTFKGVYAERVLADLARFCRANDTTFLPDERAHLILEGRREVFLRIQRNLKLDQETIWKLYGSHGE